MSFIRYKKFGNLGVVIDKEAKIFKKKEKKQLEEEKLILDFGDMTEYLLSLIYYRLCYPSARML